LRGFGCPILVRSDCTRRLDELDKVQPTIILVAKDAAGGDVAGVMVAIDGKPGVRLEGAELPVDWESTIASDQGTYIDCNDNGGHADLGRLTELQGVSWQVSPRPPVRHPARAVHLAAVGLPVVLRAQRRGHAPVT
jgi:hypothetical protein